MTVQQISEELNFPNPSFFTQYFKKNTGLTPKEYRSGTSVQ
ncbi:AraC family transcriptional regulator [Bacteroides sp. 51]|nr:AraC family transcriptional regulator [Bacteroides sp. 51]